MVQNVPFVSCTYILCVNDYKIAYNNMLGICSKANSVINVSSWMKCGLYL